MSNSPNPSLVVGAAPSSVCPISWKKLDVQPDDILDAVATIQVRADSYETDLTAGWNASKCYLAWSKDALTQSTPFGRDAAVGYAKRAVCRQIDGFMVSNHLWQFDRKLNYPEKIQMLTEIGLDVPPSLVHELVIDLRNQVEHDYRSPTEAEAKRAVELSEMFLKATSDEAKHSAIISVGWSMSIRHESCSAPGKEYDRINFKISRDYAPMLLMDVTETNQHAAMILRPKDGEVLTCPLQEFDQSAAKRLAAKLREQYRLRDSGHFSIRKLERQHLRKLKQDIGLEK